MEENDQEKADAFYRDMVRELYKAAIRWSNPGVSYEVAMGRAFEETLHRINFADRTVTTTDDNLGKLRDEEITFGLVAIGFGNFLAWKGIKLNEDVFVRSDH